MSQIESRVEVSFEPGNCEILGVFSNYLHILGNVFNDKTEELEECMITIPKEEYLRVLNIWITGKQDYCEKYNEYCGVMGYICSLDNSAEYVGISNINRWSEKLKTQVIVSLPTYMVDEFEDYCDFEHG